MKNYFKTMAFLSILIIASVYVAVQVYDQFRLTREYNFEGYRWCWETGEKLSKDGKNGKEFTDQCRTVLKKNWQLPIRESGI